MSDFKLHLVVSLTYLFDGTSALGGICASEIVLEVGGHRDLVSASLASAVLSFGQSTLSGLLSFKRHLAQLDKFIQR